MLLDRILFLGLNPQSGLGGVVAIFWLPALHFLYIFLLVSAVFVPTALLIAYIFHLRFDFWTYLHWFVLVNWVWDSVAILVLFVTQIIAGKSAADSPGYDLTLLQDIGRARLSLVIPPISLLYLSPFVLFFFQEHLVAKEISLLASVGMIVEAFLDASTFGMLSAYEWRPVYSEYAAKSLEARTFFYLANLVYSIVTLSIIWGGLRYFLSRRAV